MQTSVKVSIRKPYKIFGSRPAAVLPDVLTGMSKADLLAGHNHVLGLRDINIDIHEGQITVIMGLSGSGKSTLIRHLNRLIEPTAGEVLVDGENILTWNERRLRDLRRRTMSMVFQKFALLPHRTVLDNAGMALMTQGVPRQGYEADAIRWLDQVGLGGYGAHFPHQLSGGIQQRVGIARALTSNAGIMLMDEAFSALDPLIRTDMQRLLLELQSELHKTIVFIKHDLDEALKLADHLVILKDGQIVQQGEPQHILLNPADPYIEAFIGDINRACVLRVRSIMRQPVGDEFITGEIGADDTLEHVIAVSRGNLACLFRVVNHHGPIGILDMPTLVRALVPRRPSGAVSAD
ncbi:betaine/proline/choline family ABC transporter ATP-binding protein (plasmid) [Paracoccus liaowanqingii]|uniref:Quaternary amine transport ATP-binding protein n=1 Tax=Paracoccus liaowanqingii TaxID=2560053 RepID=A0A4Y5SUM6_9RHOB|nr:betaine/proline/choline family ABC transporter ATP-binding protein [Paracoccus liaowanqingii]QDA36505.1 betaine/proline/choline family ABC transporter ATP-binding protein [Paracoccus liaowanqingii]